METAIEARSSDTMEGCRQCDMLPFFVRLPAHGHCSPEAVSKQKLKELRLRGSLRCRRHGSGLQSRLADPCYEH